MNGLKILPVLGIVLLVGSMTACTSFAPVYGDRAVVPVESVRFNFAAPDSRLEQLIINRLKVAFPAVPTPQDPTLDITVSTRILPSSISKAFPVAAPVNVRVEASATVRQGDDALFVVTRFADTAYQSGKLTPVDIQSADGAYETAARAAAESLRTAIMAGYRPGIARPLTVPAVPQD